MIGLREVIGRQWQVPSNPPHTFDCYELVVWLRRANGRATPSVVDRHKRKPTDRRHIRQPPADWVRLKEPKPLCVVKIGENHVGLYLGRGDVAHVQAGGGVRIDRLMHILEPVTFWETAQHA